MLRTTSTTNSLKNPLLSINMAGNDEVSVGGGGDSEDEKIGKSPSKNLNGAMSYLTPNARRVFIQLRQAFTKAPILWHYDLEYYIRIEINVSGYVINRVLSQLTLNYLGQWYPVAYYLQKMIPAKTRYTIYNAEFSAIMETFKIWQHYLKSCKHKFLVFTNHNSLCHFMDIKSLNSHQIW